MDRYMWHLAGAEEWGQDGTGAEFNYGYEGVVKGVGYYYTDGTSYGHHMGAGNGWGYSYATIDHKAVGYGGMYAY